MTKIAFLFLSTILLCLPVIAQTSPANPAETAAASEAKPKQKAFRPNKEQITSAQQLLKQKGSYNGEATGRYDPELRIAIKGFQKDNGLRATGALNRATLEKMGVELTESQMAIPASPDSYAAAASSKNADNADKPKRIIFRASKDQIIEAQRTLKKGGMYYGEETGKLDDATRAGLKKYQEANGVKVTGTLNAVTLEKMGIELTEKQKSAAQPSR